MPVLVALSGAHVLNDLIQSMIPAVYPLIKNTYQLDFAQIGLITLAFQVTSSILQPILGYLTDRRPWPYAMVAGMGATLVGLLGLSFATTYELVLVAAALKPDHSSVQLPIPLGPILHRLRLQHVAVISGLLQPPSRHEEGVDHDHSALIQGCSC